MRISPARKTALRVLHRIRRSDAWARESLAAELAQRPLSPQDAAFATHLVLGVTAMRGTLDFALDRALRRPSDVEPSVRDILRMFAYEILFMSTPPHAAVDQGVEAVRAERSRAAGLANAVLRRVCEDASSFPWGDPETDNDALARLSGHPRWIVDRLIADLGRDDAKGMLHADNTNPPMFLISNPFVADDSGVFASLSQDGAEPSTCQPIGCIRVGVPAAGAASSVVETGAAVVADRGAQLAPSIVPVDAGAVVLDIGAGRGTKTFALQAYAHRSGYELDLRAVDSHSFKTDILRSRMTSLSVPGVTAFVADATDRESLLGALDGKDADAVLIDAPCSGMGTLRRHPEKRWSLKPQDVENLARLGSELLNTAAQVVRPGGSVVYSTCTVTRQENEDVIGSFLAQHGEGFCIIDLTDSVPEDLRRFVSPEGWFRSLPEEGGPDGHFVALMRRT